MFKKNFGFVNRKEANRSFSFIQLDIEENWHYRYTKKKSEISKLFKFSANSVYRSHEETTKNSLWVSRRLMK